MNRREIKKGMAYLCEVDCDIAAVFDEYGVPEPRTRAPGFEAFVAAIVSQQVSKEAAATIFARVKNLCSEFSPSVVLDIPYEELRGAGLSGRKTEYLLGLAEAIDTGDFDVEALSQKSDGEAIANITELRGFGRWSAEIYLMFALGRRDIFPADDLALQIALAKLKGLSEKAKPKLARELTANWAPWRSVGALFLWHYYRGAPQ